MSGYPLSKHPKNKLSRSWWMSFALINPVTFSVGLFLAVIIYTNLNTSQNSIAFSSLPPFRPEVMPTATPTPSYPIPQNSKKIPAPWLNARGIMISDIASGTVIYEKNADAALPQASTTKITTALVTLDNYSPKDLVTVLNANESIGSKAQIMPGEIYSIEDLLYALLLDSGNDAAVTLAQNDPGGYSTFISKMNQKAQSLGLTNTHYTNASGLDSPYHYSSARDLTVLAGNLINNPLLKTIVSSRTKIIKDKKWNRELYLVNTNQLLGVIPEVEGIKTGSTPLAGECLVTFVNKDSHPVLIVVLGSTDRFGETKELIDWVYQNFSWL